MAVGTVSLIPMNAEPFFWIVIFLFSAWVIAKTSTTKFFLNGFVLSLVNCIWITGVHIVFFASYINHHPQMRNMPLLFASHPRGSGIVTGIFIGAVCGLIVGLFAFVASKLMGKKPVIA